MTRFYLSLVALLGATSLGSAAAFGQAQAPTREQVNPQPQEQPVPPAQAHVDEGKAFAPGPCPLSQSGVTVAIRQVHFTASGGGTLPPAIAALLSDITTDANPQPISVVCSLRDQANARLRQARYVATIQVPPQTIEGGVLRLEVVTGRITQVRVRGEAGPFEGLIRRRIDQIKQLDPLNASDAEKLLVLANDVPGLNVQLGLSPDTSGKPGDLIGELTVGYRRFSLIGSTQNYNSTLLGRETFYLRGEAYDLLGLNDRTFIAGGATYDFKKQVVAQAGESIGLSSHGDRLSVSGTYAYSRPALDTLDLRTLSLIGNIEYSRPFVRTVNSRVEGALGYDYVEQRTRVYSGGTGVPLNRDRLSTLYMRLDAEMRKLRFNGSQAWTLGGTAEVRKGLDMLGASHAGDMIDGYSLTHFAGDAQAFVARGQVSGALGIGPVFELATTMRGQYSDHPLLNYDQFSLGNLTIGRGYDPGANTGDRAVAAAHEIRANIPLGRQGMGQFYAFYDWVQLWNLDPSSTERQRFLRSVGGGARVTVTGTLRLDLTYAHPLDPPLLTGTEIKRSPDRFMISLVTQLYPFGARR